MDFAFFHGLVLASGLIVALGVQNLFVFSQGVVQPTLWRAMPVVITAGCCDLLLILLAVLGISVAILTFAWVKTLLIVIGISFIAYLGWVTWYHSHQTENGYEDSVHWTRKKQITFALSVSLLNPHAILDTIGVIGTTSLSYGGSQKLAFTVACILVSFVWFFLLALAGRRLGKTEKFRQRGGLLNRISALLIWLCGVYLAFSLFH